MSMNAEATLRAARAHLDDSLTLLAALVETNTHADNAKGLARCHGLLAPRLEALGLRVEHVTSEVVQPREPTRTLSRIHLLAQTNHREDRPTVLVMGHLDTVFPIDHAFQRVEQRGDEWCGPGVSDMKGGIVTALLTLRLLQDAGRLDDANWRVVLASDEEQGSPTATSVLERAARGANLALCFEAARPCGGLVTARRGYGVVRVRVVGKTGHAGVAHDTAVNAFTVLAQVVVRAEALEQRYTELSVSPGGVVVVTPASVTSIPDHAECEIEWRFAHADDGEALLTDLRQIAMSEGRRAGAEVFIEGGVECAPMVQSWGTERLLTHYVRAAEQLGMSIRGVATAGVGDINLVSKLGAACLDGVGPEGGGFHTAREFVSVDSIARRATMNACALAACLRARDV